MSTVDLLEQSPKLVAGPPAQLVLLTAQEPEPEPSTEFSPETYLPYCEIMRAIVGPLTNEAMLLRI